jgi:hypothetical protein
MCGDVEALAEIPTLIARLPGLFCYMTVVILVILMRVVHLTRFPEQFRCLRVKHGVQALIGGR